MAVRFSDSQVCEATGAKRTRLGPRASFDSVCTDSRSIRPGSLFVALKGDRFDGHHFIGQAIDAGAVAVLVQPQAGTMVGSRDVTVFEVENTLQALGRLARAHRDRFRFPIGAVSGSNGKTTTKELIASILTTRGLALKTQGNLNNEVGVPLTLFDLGPTHVAAIVEMGMSHPGEIARLTEIARPDAGMLTVIQPAHLEGCGSIEGVADAKGELFAGLGAKAVAVVNLDDSRVEAQAARSKGPKLTFGRDRRADIRLERSVAKGRAGTELTILERGRTVTLTLRLIGEHNALNATGAFAMGLALGYSSDECAQGLASATAHPQRLQILEGKNGVTVVDDCYNANPESMRAALETLGELASSSRAVAVLGDMLELGGAETAAHASLGELAARKANLIAFFGSRTGASHEKAKERLGAASLHFDDVERLNAWLAAEVREGDVVLVKGSRGMRLERVVQALTGHASVKGH